MSLFSSIEDVNFQTKYPVDKVIGIITGSVDAAGSPSAFTPGYTEDFQSVSFNGTCLPIGRYSLDGGTTWQDFDMTIPLNPSTSTPTFQTTDVICVSKNNQVGIAVTKWTSGNVVVTYQIVCLAKKAQGVVTLINTAENVYFDSRDNYQKIWLDETRDISIAASTTTDFTFVHNLGYVPTVRGWIEYDSNGELWPMSQNQYNDSGFALNNPFTTQILLTDTDVIYRITNSAAPETAMIHSRIYLED